MVVDDEAFIFRLKESPFGTGKLHWEVTDGVGWSARGAAEDEVEARRLATHAIRNPRLPRRLSSSTVRRSIFHDDGK